MKKFVYQVAGWEFVDTIAFGDAWREAKFKASQLHEPIYRLVIDGEKVWQEVYVKSGCFLRVDLAMIKNILVF